MLPRRALLPATLWICLCSQAAFADAPPPAAAPAWRFTVGAGLTFLMGGRPNLLPYPAPGVVALAEHGRLGVEASFHYLGVTRCVNGTEADARCGSFPVLAIAPRLTLSPGRRLSPYLAASLQLTFGQRHTFGLDYAWVTDRVVVPAAGPRVGVRYRGRHLGFYVEGGVSFMPARSYESCDPTDSRTCSSWWFLQATTGLTWTFR